MRRTANGKSLSAGVAIMRLCPAVTFIGGNKPTQRPPLRGADHVLLFAWFHSVSLRRKLRNNVLDIMCRKYLSPFHAAPHPIPTRKRVVSGKRRPSPVAPGAPRH